MEIRFTLGYCDFWGQIFH